MLLLNYISQVVCQVSIGIWLRISKEHSVVIMLELVGKCKRVVAPLLSGHVLTAEVILIIRNVIASSVPALFACFKLLLRMNQHFHALIVEALGFNKI